MVRVNKEDFNYMGYDYQFRLMHQILSDNKFANTIIDILNPNYFHDDYLKVLVQTIKEAKKEYDIIPDLKSLEFRVLESQNDEQKRRFLIGTIKKISESVVNDVLYIQDSAIKFCKQQELKKAIKQIQVMIEKGDYENYDECETILKKALEHGNLSDDGMDIFENIKDVLKEDFRKPIRTGIKGLDEVMDGGLSKGELGVILAPFGVGKTTMMTKIANTAMNDGYNVLQIFFEDNPKVIQRKHIACWTGIELNKLALHEEEIIRVCAEKEENGGILKLKKFPSDGTTIPMIRQYIRKKIAEGFRPDIILVDYIDCVEPSKKFDDANVGEGSVMRQFETMLSELDIAGWTAVQGNRSSIKANVVEADQMGGSIKKGQIGHFIVSIAKTLDQKENGTATMAILKSRFGKDGIIFEDIIFDNAKIQIDMGTKTEVKTRTEHKNSVENNNQLRVTEVFEANRNRTNNLFN
jgi:replicative DNA helicase